MDQADADMMARVRVDDFDIIALGATFADSFVGLAGGYFG